jgi:hypothetical protein
MEAFEPAIGIIRDGRYEPCQRLTYMFLLHVDRLRHLDHRHRGMVIDLITHPAKQPLPRFALDACGRAQCENHPA